MTPADLGGGHLVVKDSQGKVVGAVIAPSGDGDVLHVVRSFGGQPVVLAVTADGFTNDDPTFALYYASTDCTGPPLIQENGVTASRLLLPVAGAQGGVAYYASGAIVAGESGSAETFDDPASCDPALLTPRGGCCTDALFADATSPAATV